MLGTRWVILETTQSRVEGRVVNGQTGQAIQGAIVVAARLNGSFDGVRPDRARITESRTDTVGRFSLLLSSRKFHLLLSTRRNLIVVAEGYRPAFFIDIDGFNGPVGSAAPKGVQDIAIRLTAHDGALKPDLFVDITRLYLQHVQPNSGLRS